LRVTRYALFIIILALGLSACQPEDCASSKVFCAGLVTDTLGLDDHGINRDVWAGLEAAKSNGDVDQASVIESIDPRDYEKNIAYFAGQGYDVIITTGSGLGDETLRSSDLYPASIFIGINQPQAESRGNLIPVTFAEDQMGFAAGMLAARLSKTKVIGAVCETSGIDSMWRYCEGFRAGAKQTDETVKVEVVYREGGSSESLFLDEAWGYETGKILIRRGADVIFAAGGLTGQGALRAASEADAQVHAIGTERNQSAALGDAGSSVVTSFYGRASSEVQDMMRLLGSSISSYEQVPSQVGYLPLNGNFPESLSRDLDALILKLWIGEIKTGVLPEKP